LRYWNYIASHAWRSNPVRLTELAASRGRCRLCSARASLGWRLEVHHSNYRRLGREARGDLIALCSACHRDVESFLRRRRYAVRRPIRADVVRLRDFRRPLVDPTR
jgi:5-methylcytosine-specific restriction endonuclease McrA